MNEEQRKEKVADLRRKEQELQDTLTRKLEELKKVCMREAVSVLLSVLSLVTDVRSAPPDPMTGTPSTGDHRPPAQGLPPGLGGEGSSGAAPRGDGLQAGRPLSLRRGQCLFSTPMPPSPLHNDFGDAVLKRSLRRNVCLPGDEQHHLTAGVKGLRACCVFKTRIRMLLNRVDTSFSSSSCSYSSCRTHTSGTWRAASPCSRRLWRRLSSCPTRPTFARR